MADSTFRVFRGDTKGGDLVTYRVPVTQGMAVLDGILYIQAHVDGTLACRWNCRAGRCGSCGAEINERPRLMCKTSIDEFKDEPITVRPMRVFPVIKDLVSDVSWNYGVNEQIPPFTPGPTDHRAWTIHPEEMEGLFELRRCIECFLCQDICNVLRESGRPGGYMGPRLMVRVAALEAHPKDVLSRTDLLRGPSGFGFCNIARACQDVCPEGIRISDAAIIPLKERLGDDYLEPWRFLLRLFGSNEQAAGA